jgi:hypothetical protein
MSRAVTIRLSDEGQRRLLALTDKLGWTQVGVVEEALDQLYQEHFPQKHEPSIITWEPVTFITDVTCSDLGTVIPAGTTAYREIWSDDRTGEIVSREALVADGILFD